MPLAVKDHKGKVYEPSSFITLPTGRYVLETYFFDSRTSPETMINRNVIIPQERISLILSNEADTYTAVLNHSSYLEGYLNSLHSLSQKRTLEINDEAHKARIQGSTLLSFEATTFLDRLAMEQAYLLPNIKYTINDYEDIRVNTDSIDVKFSFNSDKGLNEVVMHAFVEPTHSESKTSPYLLRLKNFFTRYYESHIPLTPFLAIPVILDATNMNAIFRLLHGDSELPLLGKGEVYVLDSVSEWEDTGVYLRYYDYEDESKISNLLRKSNDELEAEETQLLNKYLRIIKIETFPDNNAENGRTQKEVKDFFQGHIDHGSVLFSPIDNLYQNSMDYMKSPLTDPSIPRLLIFKAYPGNYTDLGNERLLENVKKLREEALGVRSRKYTTFDKDHKPTFFPDRVP